MFDSTSDAVPEARVEEPSEVAPLKNCTVPAAPAPVTVAVSVREAGATAVAVAGDIASEVVVVTCTGGGAVTVSATLPEVDAVNAAGFVGVNTAWYE